MSISPLEALTIYTKGGAYLQFMEREKGALAPGMYADFAIWDTDLLTCPAKDILTAQVAATYINGECVFSR